jgi:hypothetical protein
MTDVRPMGEELRGRVEGVRSMIVHDVFVTRKAREDKAEKFIPWEERN